ncbi:carbonic anhydrase [Burkholderia ubonensis]|uniref:Carbonic anhydrase n=4 Tax=Burkholderia ubonensis TaxID=101571 RepID=A0AB73FV92_9BURK|nr:carbonic anhydrase [Burkholderia ubonensis]KVK83893.1 carbonic anhydrase [Burkholderia ubonensis]KVL82932.1 carbonic anhydrase [Burkholderia ubonensis]KVM23929.1 carbonic anhydrase [Burkholderia ubonensis]
MCDSKTCMVETATPTRRSFLRKTGASAFAAAIGSVLTSDFALAAEATVLPKPQNALSPDDAVKRLMEGNARYVLGVTRRHDFTHEREALSGGQNPYAAVLSCADSRIAPEYAFDSARGDLFATRVAGNFVNDDVLGSLEYAVAVLNVPVILVLGHDKCGAVDAAVKVATKGATYPGKIQSLATTMLPAVNKVKGEAANLLDAAIAQNVRDSVVNLHVRSAIMQEAKQAGKLRIVGGVYRLSTGKVELLG